MNSFKFVIDGWVFFGCDFIFLFTKNNDFIFILNSYYCILNIQMTSYRNYSKTQKNHFVFIIHCRQPTSFGRSVQFFLCCIQFRNKAKLNLYYFTSFQKQVELHVLICVRVGLSPNTAVLYQPIFSNLIIIYVTVFHLTKKKDPHVSVSLSIGII